ncbi:hypothetical protein ACVIGB_000750 [Bradyrhizobium sp. USDA 4341]
MSLIQDLERKAVQFAATWARDGSGTTADMMAAFAAEMLRAQARSISALWDQAFKTKELLETNAVDFTDEFRATLAQELKNALAPTTDSGGPELQVVGDETSAAIVPFQREEVVYRPGKPFRQEVRGPDVALHTVFPIVEHFPFGLRVRALAVEETAQRQIVSALNALAYSPLASPVGGMDLYIIVGVDQDGDANWDVTLSLSSAVARKLEMDEVSYEPNKIYCIKVDERELIVAQVEQAELAAAMPPEEAAPAP